MMPVIRRKGSDVARNSVNVSTEILLQASSVVKLAQTSVCLVTTGIIYLMEQRVEHVPRIFVNVQMEWRLQEQLVQHIIIISVLDATMAIICAEASGSKKSTLGKKIKLLAKTSKNPKISYFPHNFK